MNRRELSANERSAIKNLVISMCANYDGAERICLILGGACYMLGKCQKGGFCKYFRTAVLPTEPALEARLVSGMETKTCVTCGKRFTKSGNGKQTYCSVACADKARRTQKREYMRKKRGMC